MEHTRARGPVCHAAKRSAEKGGLIEPLFGESSIDRNQGINAGNGMLLAIGCMSVRCSDLPTLKGCMSVRCSAGRPVARLYVGEVFGAHEPCGLYVGEVFGAGGI